MAYAICAERLFAGSPNMFVDEPASVPVLVHLLYQSLEVSLKHIGRYFNLWPKYTKGGEGSLDRSHDLDKLVKVLQAALPRYNIRVLLSGTVGQDHLGANFVGRMLASPEFKDTRSDTTLKK